MREQSSTKLEGQSQWIKLEGGANELKLEGIVITSMVMILERRYPQPESQGLQEALAEMASGLSSTFIFPVVGKCPQCSNNTQFRLDL